MAALSSIACETEEIERLAAHSHEQVRATLTRKQEAELAALTS